MGPLDVKDTGRSFQGKAEGQVRMVLLLPFCLDGYQLWASLQCATDLSLRTRNAGCHRL